MDKRLHNHPQYLKASEAIDWEHDPIRELAASLADSAAVETARGCFEWVRDNVYHCADYRMNPVVWRASDVLQVRAGYCFAKSHLLVALLRANGLPSGFCYQWLWADEIGRDFSLHGFAAVWLAGHGWYRCDPRGNKPGVDAQFTPPLEQLAFAGDQKGERTFPEIWPDPLPIVVDSLRACREWNDFHANRPELAFVGTQEDGA